VVFSSLYRYLISLATTYKLVHSVVIPKIPVSGYLGSLSPLIRPQDLLEVLFNGVIPVVWTYTVFPEAGPINWIGYTHCTYFLYFTFFFRTICFAMMASMRNVQPDYQSYGRPIPTGPMDSARRYGIHGVCYRPYLLTKLKRGICRN
jgi:hypothetical protein